MAVRFLARDGGSGPHGGLGHGVWVPGERGGINGTDCLNYPKRVPIAPLVEAARLTRIAAVDPQLWRYFRKRRRKKRKLGLPLARHDACAGGVCCRFTMVTGSVILGTGDLGWLRYGLGSSAGGGCQSQRGSREERPRSECPRIASLYVKPGGNLVRRAHRWKEDNAFRTYSVPQRPRGCRRSVQS